MKDPLNIHPSSTRWQGSRCVDRGVFCAECWCGRWNQGASLDGSLLKCLALTDGVCWYVRKRPIFLLWICIKIVKFREWNEMTIQGNGSWHFKLNSWRNLHPGWITDQFTLKVQFQMDGSGMMCSWMISFLTQDNKYYVGYHFFKGTSGDNHFRVFSSRVQLAALRFGILEISGFKLFTTLYGNLNT